MRACAERQRRCGHGCSDPKPALAVSGILAIVRLAEERWFAFLSPDDVASAARVLRERSVSLAEMPIDCTLAFVDRLIVAIVNNSAGHPTEDRLYHIQELGTAGSGASSTRGARDAGLTCRALIASTLSMKAFDACHDAASDDR